MNLAVKIITMKSVRVLLKLIQTTKNNKKIPRQTPSLLSNFLRTKKTRFKRKMEMTATNPSVARTPNIV